MNSRRFNDALGCAWTVWSVRPDGNAEAESLDHLPSELRDGWLLFARGMERRRLSPIPDGWWRCDERGLRGLCEQAVMERAYAGIPFPL